ncbi:hypothetical protein F2P56_019413 [Juglans regia]|uniref:Uncharacterized protein n=2 Tax=Juglans regia TaxID=51240 RepID=A0A834CSP9_JUGRE|nr:uncharacterized protein LOC109004483 isoform X2 [Juglans regia]XP_018838588.1 uncharacterized protein LOC109004483 isoform X1 [Juglans regia]KAF5463506.1 hypothetical protein F2P56_019413 [Juglans regia]KAF5463507.1 hypothetical protein F2P56_019413 [Juglans regia]
MSWYSYGSYPNNSGADEWSKASHDSDHVYRPVIVDAEGRTLPIIVRTTNQSTAQMAYAAKVERTTEHVRIPLVSDYTYDSPPKVLKPVKNDKYRYSSPPKAVEPVKSNYGYRHSSPPKLWVRPSSPHEEEPEDNTHSYRSISPPKVEPMKNYGYHEPQPVLEYGYKAQPVKDYGYEVEPGKSNNYADDKWGRPLSPARDRPPEVEDLLDKVQTEASRPKKLGSLGVPSRGQTPQSNVQNGISPGYGGYSTDYSNNYLQKPSGNITLRNNEDYDHYRMNDNIPGGWARPRPTNGATALRKPTSDIATAVQNLKEAVLGLSVANNAPPQSKYPVPISKQDTYPETIDSREAARRYGNFNLPRPRTTDETYTPTINSTEAAKKYRGANIA